MISQCFITTPPNLASSFNQTHSTISSSPLYLHPSCSPSYPPSIPPTLPPLLSPHLIPSPPLYYPPRAIFAQTIKVEGLRGLYTGMNAQILRDIPFYATFFGTYDFSCRYLRTTTAWNDTAVYFVSGGLAGQVSRE